MKTEIKTKWLEALRSGDYKQAKGALVKQAEDGSKSYCCLGVLCDLAKAEGVVREENVPCGCGGDGDCSIKHLGFRGDENSPDGRYRAYSYGVLPWPVMEWAGIDVSDPSIEVESEIYEGEKTDRFLSGLNDSGQDFEIIADYIEASL